MPSTDAERDQISRRLAHVRTRAAGSTWSSSTESPHEWSRRHDVRERHLMNDVNDRTSVDDRALLRTMEQVIYQAVEAPSVHNTQPWRFAVSPERMTLSADHTRQLRVLDPTGRQLADQLRLRAVQPEDRVR